MRIKPENFVKVGRDGKAHVRLSNHMIYGLSLLLAASLLEEGENTAIRTIYEALPARSSLTGEHDLIVNGSATIKVPTAVLAVLRDFLMKGSKGGWSNGASFDVRIAGIDALPALQLLASAAE